MGLLERSSKLQGIRSERLPDLWVEKVGLKNTHYANVFIKHKITQKKFDINILKEGYSTFRLMRKTHINKLFAMSTFYY